MLSFLLPQFLLIFRHMILTVMTATFIVTRERPKQDSNPDTCNTSSLLHQMSYQDNWEQVNVMWVDLGSKDDGHISDVMRIHEIHVYLNRRLNKLLSVFCSQLWQLINSKERRAWKTLGERPKKLVSISSSYTWISCNNITRFFLLARSHVYKKMISRNSPSQSDNDSQCFQD